MPIYAYRCEDCGHAKDVLQKVSDPVLTVCPACGASSFSKQVTAAGFQLKGSGWYVTDFKGKGKDNVSDAASAAKDSAAPAAGSADTGTPSKPSEASGAGGAPASGCGSSCACH
jgi:putative FmdB family regulatory protein